MKEKSPATASTLGRILATCSKQLITRDYGSCVASKVPEVERDLCFKEFLALKNCMQHTPVTTLIDLKSMSNRVSSSQPSVGSGGLSYAYIQHPSLRCNIPESMGLFYDDANRLLISTTSSQLSRDPTVKYSFFIEKPSRYLTTNVGQDQRAFSDSFGVTLHYVILQFGMDLFACDSMLNLCLVETKKVNVNWYIYTHETRLVLLASGLQCKTVTGFQPDIYLIYSAGVVRLPRFEMTMARSESNSQTILYSNSLPFSFSYGRIYRLQVDREAMQLHTYTSLALFFLHSFIGSSYRDLYQYTQANCL
ncbi:unnamed protein product [Brassica oleracea]